MSARAFTAATEAQVARVRAAGFEAGVCGFQKIEAQIPGRPFVTYRPDAAGVWRGLDGVSLDDALGVGR